MRPTRPSWKPSGPSHRRSPLHKALDRLTHFIVILSPSDGSFMDLGPSSHHIVSTHLYSVGITSLSDTLLSCIRTRRGDVRLIPYPPSEILRPEHRTTDRSTTGSPEAFCRAIWRVLLSYIICQLSLPSHPLSRYLDRRTIINAHTKPNFPIVFRSRDLEM